MDNLRKCLIKIYLFYLVFQFILGDQQLIEMSPRKAAKTVDDKQIKEPAKRSTRNTRNKRDLSDEGLCCDVF